MKTKLAATECGRHCSDLAPPHSFNVQRNAVLYPKAQGCEGMEAAQGREGQDSGCSPTVGRVLLLAALQGTEGQWDWQLAFQTQTLGREWGSWWLCPKGGLRSPRGRGSCGRILTPLGGGCTGMPPPPSLAVKTEVQRRSPSAFLPGVRVESLTLLQALRQQVNHQNRGCPGFVMGNRGDKCPDPRARFQESWSGLRSHCTQGPACWVPEPEEVLVLPTLTLSSHLFFLRSRHPPAERWRLAGNEDRGSLCIQTSKGKLVRMRNRNAHIYLYVFK